MENTKAHIIERLQQEMRHLQGFNPGLKNISLDLKLGSIKNAFPNHSFPLGAIHELLAASPEDIAVTAGFVAFIVSALMKNNSHLVWIGNTINVFPPTLKSFGITPDRIIFIQLNKEKEILWAMEEALKCEGLAAVVGQLQDLNFLHSRRLQLAVEKSGVTGFVIRQNIKNLSANACVSRWRITSLHSETQGAMPGVGFPRWNIVLEKIRNGRPGQWQVELSGKRLKLQDELSEQEIYQQKKAG